MPEDEPSTNPEEQIFEEALKLGAGEKRDAFLEGVCRGEHGLRAQLDAMIKAHEGAAGFLDTLPDDQTVVDQSLAEGPGTQIGQYKLLQQIGEGGMGVAYMAEQEGALRRKVAFKIIKLGTDTKSVVARFGAKRPALALMNHPTSEGDGQGRHGRATFLSPRSTLRRQPVCRAADWQSALCPRGSRSSRR